MTWYALDALDRAVEETKDLLFPFDWKLWAKLAVIVFFVSGVNMPNNMPSLPGDDTSSDMGEFSDPTGPGLLSDSAAMTGFASAVPQSSPVFAVVLLLLFVVGIAFMVASSVFEFVYYRSLIDKEVVLRDNFMTHLEEGLRLFGFRIGVAIVLLLGALPLAAMFTAGSQALMVTAVLIAIPVFLAFVLFMFLTSQFIPLVMMEHELSVIAAWRRFYGTLQDEWKQAGLYVVIWIVLNIAIAILIGFASLLLLLPLAPFAIAFFFLGLPEAVGIIFVILGAVVWFVLSLYALRVPTQTYLRYYTLLVYNDLTA